MPGSVRELQLVRNAPRRNRLGEAITHQGAIVRLGPPESREYWGFLAPIGERRIIDGKELVEGMALMSNPIRQKPIDLACVMSSTTSGLR